MSDQTWPFLLNAPYGTLTDNVAIGRWRRGIHSNNWPQLVQSRWTRTSGLTSDTTFPLRPSPASSATATQSRASVSRGKGPKMAVRGKWGVYILNIGFETPKRHFLARNRVLWCILRQNRCARLGGSLCQVSPTPPSRVTLS